MFRCTMIWNAYAVLDVFLSGLRLGLGIVVAVQALLVLRWWARRAGPEDAAHVEDRGYLLFSLAGLLLGVGVLSWPIFYLLLQSYVAEWPGVMCIYGVTRIGLDSAGVSRFLPTLLTGLQAVKPALVFLSGAWFVLYLINRKTRTAPLTGRVLVVVLAAALVAAGDAAAELAYLAIPKKEELPSGGCCTFAFDARDRLTRYVPGVLVGEDVVPWLYAAYYGVNLAMVLALGVAHPCLRTARPFGVLLLLVLGTVLATIVNGIFLVEVFAPRVLHLPYHHCPYDLVSGAPESLLAPVLFLGGSFAIGWAWLAAWLARSPETEACLPATIRGLVYLGIFGYAAALVTASLELLLA